MLPENRRRQLDTIVQQMIVNKEKDDAIHFVVNDFKQKYDQPEQGQGQPGLLEKISPGTGKLSSSDFMKSGSGVVDPASQGSTQMVPGAGGITGLAKSVGGALFSSEVNFGKTLGEAAATLTPEFKGAQDAINHLSDVNAKLNQAIIKGKQAGHDVSHLEDLAKSNQNFIDQNIGMKNVTPSIAKTPEQIYGEALGTAADIASFGEYGAAAKGAESGKLLSSSVQKGNILADKAANKALLTPRQRLFKDIGMAGVSAGTVAGLQGTSGAMQANKSLEDTLSAGMGSAAGGAAFGAGISIGGKVLGKIAKSVVSTMSGVPQGAMEHMLENPEETTKAMRAFAADPDHGPQSVLASAEEAFGAVKKSRDDAYKFALDKVQSETMQFKNGDWYIQREVTPRDVQMGLAPESSLGMKNTWVKTNLTTKGVKDTITRTLKDFGGQAAGSNIDLSEVPLPNAYKNDLKEVVDKVYGWKDTSPVGMNRLRQNLDVYYKASTDTSRAAAQYNAIVSRIKGNLASYVSDRVPQLGEMNRQFTVATDFIDKIKEELKVGKNVMDQTKLNKLLQTFNPNKQEYKELVGQLGEQGGRQLLSDIAGLTMSKWTPEGLAKYFTGLGAVGSLVASPGTIPAAVSGIAASSPRLVGEALSAGVKIGKTKTSRFLRSKTIPFIAGRVANGSQTPQTP